MSEEKPQIEVRVIQNGEVIKTVTGDYLIGRLGSEKEPEKTNIIIIGGGFGPIDMIASTLLISHDVYEFLVTDMNKKFEEVNPEEQVSLLFNHVCSQLKRGVYVPQTFFEKVEGKLDKLLKENLDGKH